MHPFSARQDSCELMRGVAHPAAAIGCINPATVKAVCEVTLKRDKRHAISCSIGCVK